jgi:hypothetical protein
LRVCQKTISLVILSEVVALQRATTQSKDPCILHQALAPLLFFFAFALGLRAATFLAIFFLAFALGRLAFLAALLAPSIASDEAVAKR